MEYIVHTTPSIQRDTCSKKKNWNSEGAVPACSTSPAACLAVYSGHFQGFRV